MNKLSRNCLYYYQRDEKVIPALQIITMSASIFEDSAYKVYLRQQLLTCYQGDYLEEFMGYLTHEEMEIFANNERFWFVVDHYDSNTIETVLTPLVSLMEGDDDYYGVRILGEAWSLIPKYLKRFKEFHSDLEQSVEGAFELLHRIITQQPPCITLELCKKSYDLESGLCLSLDTGLIIRVCDSHGLYMCFGLVSSSKAKLRFALKTLESNLWPSLNIDDLLRNAITNKHDNKFIRGKLERKFYNVSTHKLMDSGEVERKSLFLSANHMTTSEDKDHMLLHYINELLDNLTIRWNNPIEEMMKQSQRFRVYEFPETEESPEIDIDSLKSCLGNDKIFVRSNSDDFMRSTRAKILATYDDD